MTSGKATAPFRIAWAALVSENLLKYETSPYLLQHKDNPVHWRPWGAAAFEEAKRLDKPIFLSVGYSACHWCHVMAHESFESPEVAALMNELFVNVKVDREERPDVDQAYMAGLHALGGRGGWPLTAFLTPDGDLYWGGTYFPPTARFGRAGFPDILRQVESAYRATPDRVAQNAARAASAIRPTNEIGTLTAELISRTGQFLLDKLDPTNGGFLGAPKFPQGSLLEFLLRAALRAPGSGHERAFLLAMRRICQGGIFDHVGGGFARYSTDERWFAPHFEKMLYDNAQIVVLLTNAWKISRDELFARRAAQTIAWLHREMTVEGGAFAASLDADSEGSEGKFYVWTKQELSEALGAQDGARAAAAFGAQDAGNWEGSNILHRLDAPDSPAQEDAGLDELRTRLLAARASRARPGRDDKVLADWNGLMIEALCVAGSCFERADWVALGERAYRFILDDMTLDGRVGHSARLGRVSRPGLSSDGACLVAAALALNEATARPDYLEDAIRIQEALDAYHFDPDQGYLLTARDATDLKRRPGGAQDDATPNPNAKSAANLVRLGHLTGETRYLERAERLFDVFGGSAERMPLAYLGLLNAFDFAAQASDVVVVGPLDRAEGLMREIFCAPTPNLIVTRAAPGALGLPSPAFGRPSIGSAPTVYVCRGGTCSLPLTQPAPLREALARTGFADIF